ncbi:MAG: PDZ domain-containing protein [Deltaproteobacteria bacterium]|nr:PDZ domain-containing protein [Deltaproteobacteria bacterium]
MHLRTLGHIILFPLALAGTLLAYHLASGRNVLDVGEVGASPLSIGTQSAAAPYRLSEMRLFEHTRYFVKEKYVDPTRIDPEEMFEKALDLVERQVDRVLFDREPQGSLLHVSVGSYTTTLQVEPVRTLDDLGRHLRKVATILEERLSDANLEPEEIEYAFINGMLSTLDPHSVLMPPEAADEMDTENQGEFGGLGITIVINEKGRLSVEYPLEGTPAYRGGLKPGDEIIRIDDESTINMTLDEAVAKLRGRPGEPVTLTIQRSQIEKPQHFTIVREVIRYNPVEGQLLEGGIGYVRIRQFHARTSQDLDAVLAGFRRDLGHAPSGIVLDLRDNSGGYYTQAVEVADRWLSSGVVVSTVNAGGRRDVDRAQPGRTEPDYPVAVLTNAHSASAAEIVAGALRSLNRAATFGERTFGKGSVQHLYDNSDRSKLKLTVAQYLTPGDRSIQSVGITPDVALEGVVVEPRPERIKAACGGKVEDKSKLDPVVSFLWRALVQREADLDRHLQSQAAQRDDQSTYTVRYLHDLAADAENRCHEKKDLSTDWQVQFVRSVLLSSAGSRRADVVAAAGALVEGAEREQDERIVEAFRALGTDWSPGPQPSEPDLCVALDLGPEGEIVAGKETRITVRVTNRGPEPVHRVLAVASADNELDETEYFFGRIGPGETRAYSRRVTLAAGYPSELDRVRFHLKDADGHPLGDSPAVFRSRRQDLPRFAWSFRLLDDRSGQARGDGDGIPEVGEVIDLEVGVTNVGPAPSEMVFAKVRNKAGRDIDLRGGTLELGGAAPGETVSGRFTFEVRGLGEDGRVPLEFHLGDANELYDYGAVVRTGFFEYAMQQETLSLPVFEPEAPVDPDVRSTLADLGRVRTPPAIELTREPDLVTTDADIVLSGLLRDDQGVRDLMVFHAWKDADGERRSEARDLGGRRGEGELEKVYFRGAGPGLVAMPFSVERRLQPGFNNFVLLGHDDEGFTLARTVSVFLDARASVADEGVIDGEAPHP